MKLLSTLLACIVVLTIAHAQDAKYLEFSLGLKKYQARDEYQSPLTYKGLVLSRGIGYNRVKNDQQVRSHFERLSGQLSNKATNRNTLEYNGANYQSNRYSIIDSPSSVNYFLGVSLKAIFGFRTKSSRSQFDTSVSLSLVGAATYKKEADDRWSHEAVLSLPFFAWSVRPRYTSPLYLKTGPKWKRPSHLFMTIPKYLGFDFRMGSIWEMDNGNAFRFSYESQYYQILPLHPVRVFNHGIVTTALMKIN